MRQGPLPRAFLEKALKSAKFEPSPSFFDFSTHAVNPAHGKVDASTGLSDAGAATRCSGLTTTYRASRPMIVFVLVSSVGAGPSIQPMISVLITRSSAGSG